MATPVIQFKRGLLSNLPSLRAGEPGFTTDSYDLYVGLDNNLSNNKFFGSHRYWIKETTTVGSGVNLVEGTNNGSDYITLKSPDSLSGITTYVFPGSPINGYVLTTDANGVLTWTESLNSLNIAGVVGGIGTFTNDVGFTSTTDNVLGDPDTGAVQIDGGLGVNKNVTVGAGLSVVQDFYVGGNVNVSGVSTFVGSVTFQGGIINLGDDNTDDINVAGEFISNLVPNTDDTYDIGDSATPKRWRNAAFSGVGTFATGAVVDAVQIGITASGEIDTSSGDLTLDSASGQTNIDDNVYISGIATVNSDFYVNGNITLGSDSGDTLTINATTDFGGGITGTISTATRAQTVDTTTASDNTYYPGLFLNSTGVAGTTVFVDSGISYVSNTDTLAITGALDVNGGADIFGLVELDDVNVSGAATVAGALDVNGGADIFGLVELDDVNVSGAATVAGALDVNGGADISGGETTLSSATVSDLTAGRVVLAGTSGSLEDSGNLTFSAGGLIVGSGGINVTGVSTFSTDLVVGGDIRVNGNDIQASDGNTNITLTSNTLTTFAGDIRVNGNDIQASDGNTNITLTSNTLTTFAGDIKVGGNDIQTSDGTTAITISDATGNVTVAGDLTVGGNDIKASDGTTSLTLVNSTGAVTASNDLTVQGNLYVNGNTTQVNTTELSVYDRTITLGIQTGSTPSTTTWDLGVLMNYGDAGVAKTAGVIWEYGTERFVFSANSDNPSSSSTSTPNIAVSAYAPIEIGALWVNDCAGQSQVISCTGTERFLENITIDAGTF